MSGSAPRNRGVLRRLASAARSLGRSASKPSQAQRGAALSARSGPWDASEPAQAERMNTLMADIRAFGRLPRLTRGNKAECALVERLRKGRRQDLLSESQVAELEAMETHDSEQERPERMTTLMADIRASGRGGVGNTPELAMADPLRWAKRRGQLSDSHRAEQPVMKVPRTGSERLTPESGLSPARGGASQPASSQR